MKKELKKLEIVALSRMLGGKKIGKLSKEGAFALLDNKIELSKHIKAIEEAQKIAAEEYKPEELKQEGAVETDELKEQWNKAYGEYMSKYMDEKLEVEIHEIGREDLLALVQENDMSIDEFEFLTIIKKSE